MADRSVSVPMILSDLERRACADAKCKIMKDSIYMQDIMAHLQNYARTGWPKMAEIGMVTHVG